MSEIPALLRGDDVTPSSGVGSNAGGSTRSDVSLVIIGGGYSPDDVQKITAAADQVKPLAFFVADVTKTAPGATGPPPGEVIKKRLVDTIDAEEKGEGEWAPGVYKY